ncbi:MAG TPA: hypothetical protein VF316_05160 [Polyangiaceae bacterium]
MAEPIPKRHRSGSGYRGLRDSEISSLAAPFYGLGHGHGLGLVKKVGAAPQGFAQNTAASASSVP